jgi:hypothetical protein
MARRTSVIWKPTNEEFAQMVKESNSMSELLRMFNLDNKGNNFKTCKKKNYRTRLKYRTFFKQGAIF